MEIGLNHITDFSNSFLGYLEKDIYTNKVIGRAIPFSAEDNAICFYYINSAQSETDFMIDIGVYARFRSDGKTDTDNYIDLMNSSKKMAQSSNYSLSFETDIGYANTDRNGNATHVVIIFSLRDLVDYC